MLRTDRRIRSRSLASAFLCAPARLKPIPVLRKYDIRTLERAVGGCSAGRPVVARRSPVDQVAADAY